MVMTQLFSALFCCQVCEITTSLAICHGLYSKDELCKDVQPRILGNFSSSFVQYLKYLTFHLYWCLYLHIWIYE